MAYADSDLRDRLTKESYSRSSGILGVMDVAPKPKIIGKL